MPQITDGQLNLQEWDFLANGKFYLAGQWKHDDKNEVTKADVDTCRLVIQTRDTDALLLRFSMLPAAHRLWVNSELASDIGILEIKYGWEGTGFAQRIYSAQPIDHQLDIVLQFSNHQRTPKKFEACSFGNAPLLGVPQHILQDNLFQPNWQIFILGGVFMIGFYHLALFFLQRKEYSNLLLATYCWLWGINFATSFMGEWAVLTLLPDLPRAYLRRIEHATLYLSVPVCLTFLWSLFPTEVPKIALRGTWILFAISCGVSYILSLSFAAKMMMYMIVPIGITMLYGVVVVTNALRHQQPGAPLAFVAYLLLAIFGGNEILHAWGLIHTTYLMLLGVFLFMLFQSFAVSKRFSLAFNAVEELSTELENNNKELTRMNAVKDEFLANTSHELRTPLHGIAGIAESLLESDDAVNIAQNKENVSLIVSCTQRLIFLINDILDLSRLKHRDISLQKKSVDFNTLTGTVMELLKHLAVEKPISLEKDFPQDLPFVVGDENRLQQILFNLIGNSIKFTSKGYVRISARQRDTMVEVQVSDSGRGMSSLAQKRIFEPYEQGDSPLGSSGAGIGLYVTRKLVELHGGCISVVSSLHKGTTFIFTLKIATALPSLSGSLPPASSTDHKTPPFVPNHGEDAPIVLAVDDEAVNQRILANHLGQGNIGMKAAYDGATCLALLDDEEPLYDLVLLDLNMPGMDGLEVCRRIRMQHSPEKLPVIILTARNGPAALASGFECGANDYISKPFSRQELLSRVQLHLSLKTAYEQLEDRMRMEVELEKRRLSEATAHWRAEQEKSEKLRFQFAPHFMFNVLNTIRASILDAPNCARQMVTDLAELNRMTIKQRSLSHTTVFEEMKMVRLYLQLEQARYGDYLSVCIQVEKACEQLSIPCFILQPLVENAIKYGKQTAPDILDIKITVHLSKSVILLQVSNSGEWVPADAPRILPSTGFGLSHLKERLHLSNASLQQRTDKNGVHMTIRVSTAQKSH